MLGRDLVEVLKENFQLYGLGRKKRKILGVHYFQCDLLDLNKTEKIISKVKPDVVIHAAAKTQVDECELNPKEAYRENVLATLYLLKGLGNQKPLLIHISSDYVYSGNAKGKVRESEEINPVNVYGYSKWLAEELVGSWLGPKLILRTSWLYGRNGHNFVKAILNISRAKKVLKVVSDQKGSPTYTKDLAQSIKKIILKWKKNKSISGVFHLSNSGVTHWKKYADQIIKLAGRKHVKVVPIKTKDYSRPAMRPKNSCLDNSKLKRVFGFQMRDWNLALNDYMVEEKIIKGK